MYSYTKKKLNNSSDEYAINSFWFILFSVMIVHRIMPVVGRAISNYLTTYFLLGIVALIMVFFISWKMSEWISQLLPLLIITVILAIARITAGESALTVVYGTLLFDIVPILMAMRTMEMPFKQRRLLVIIAAVALIITIITSIAGLITNPGAARFIATVADASDPENIRYEWMNIGGFSFTYILITTYPVVICYMKETNTAIWKRILFIVIMALFFANAEYTTALVTFTVLSTLWFMPKSFSTSKMLAVIGFLLLLFFVAQTPVSKIFYSLSESIGSTTLSERFLYIADSLAGMQNDSDVGLREILLRRSWNGFLDNPILGDWMKEKQKSGGHSYLLDFMCTYGTVGLILQIIAYKRIHSIFYSKFKETPYFGYAMCSFLIAIIMSTVNTGNHWFELTLLVPLILSVISPKDINEDWNK